MRIEASGPRPVDDTWEQYTRADAWSEWAPQIRSVRGVSGHVRAGDRGVVHGPFPVRVPFTIVSVDSAAHRWTWIGWRCRGSVRSARPRSAPWPLSRPIPTRRRGC